MTTTERTFVVGALVQWTGSKTYGVVTDCDHRTVQVRWDDAGPPRQFAITNPPLERVELQGQQIRLVETGENAVVLQAASSDAPAWLCFVASGAGRTVNVPEAALRPVPVTDPVQRFQAGLIGSIQQYRLQDVTRSYRTMHLHDDLVSLGQSGVDIKPHQVSVVHKVVSNYPHRFLLCDEVGLGKTIEAGMILKELRARGGARRVLAIVPPNIVRQWHVEMKTKFNESFSVLNRNTVSYRENQGQSGNPFASYESVLCSSRWVANPKWAKLCAEVDWDLVIVDEAHHARSHRSGNKIETTRLYRLVRDLAAPNYFARRGMLFLTATPMQLDTHELYSLVEMLDPALFPSEDHFERHRTKAPGLSHLVERLIRHGFPLPDQEPDTTVARVAGWLELDEDETRRRLSAGREEREAVANELADRHLLSEVLIRNRKAVVGGFMPRVATRWEVELTPEESAALEAVESYVQSGFQIAERANDRALGFVMVIFQKIMASSIAAIKESLSRRRDKVQAAGLQFSGDTELLEEELDDDLDDDLDENEVIGAVGGGFAQELAMLDTAIEALDRVEVDSKARVVVRELSRLFHHDRDAKVLLFTQFRGTQRFLADLLSTEGWEVNVFHGQLSPQEKDSAVERFKNGAGPQILISTEAGGEGRNFQFCHLLVNYDLPWNPMRVEQRIGRIDRIGQEDTVSIFNLWVKDTVEERVLDVLQSRIRVFEETVGGLDPILGETEGDIRKILRTAGEKREEAFEEFGRRIEDRVRHARTADSQLGDFIMDTKSYRRELAEQLAGRPSPIGNDDLDRFVGQLLADARTYIKPRGDLYELTFHGEILDSHRQLFAGGPKKRAVFRPDRRPDAEDVEFMAFGHPIVDALTAKVLGEKYEGVTGTRRVPAGEDLEPCAGWLFTYQFTVPGVRSTEHVEPFFVDDDGKVSLETGCTLVQRGYRFDSNETEIEPSEIPDNLLTIAPIADRFAGEWREELQRDAETAAAQRVDREVSRLTAWFDYRERAARDRVDATRNTLDSIRASGDESQRQILPVWEANLRRDTEVLDNLAPERSRRLAEAESHRHPQVTWALKSLGRIEVVEFKDAEDPDAGLELREDIQAELRASLVAAAVDGATRPAEEVALRQGLSW